MTDREVLKLLNKEELISVILEANDFRLMSKFRKTVVARYEKEANNILDEMKKCGFETLKGRFEYRQLEERYEKINKVFNGLCNLEVEE